MGAGSYDIAIKCEQGKTIGRKFESVRDPAIVAKNIDS